MSTREIVRRFYDTLLARDWDGFGTTLAPDVVYEVPQTGEVIRGRAAYVRFNQEYPGDWTFEVSRLVCEQDRAAGTMNFRVGDESMVGVTFFELRDGLVERLTDIWPEPYRPPAGREHLTEIAGPDDFRDRFSRPQA